MAAINVLERRHVHRICLWLDIQSSAWKFLCRITEDFTLVSGSSDIIGVDKRCIQNYIFLFFYKKHKYLAEEFK